MTTPADPKKTANVGAPRPTSRLARYVAGLWLHMRGDKVLADGTAPPAAAGAAVQQPPLLPARCFFGDPLPEVPGEYLEAKGARREGVVKLIAAMEDPTVSIVGLTGHTGIGKTALVTHLLETRERFGKPFVLWFDAHPDADPLRNDALYLSGEMLEARPDLAEKAKAVPGGRLLDLSDLLEQDCLLVIDNLESRLQDDRFAQDGEGGRDAFLVRLLTQRARSRGSMKILLVSWRMPRLPLTPRVREVRLDSGLTEAQSRRLLLQYAAGREAEDALTDPAQQADVNQLLALCDGIPSALVTAVAFLNLPGKRTVARLLQSPWFMDPALDLDARLRRCMQSVAREAKEDPCQRTLLTALALLSAPFSAESEEDGLAKFVYQIAEAEGNAPPSLEDIHVALHRLTPGFAHSWAEPDEDGGQTVFYVLNPLFSWAILENLENLEAGERSELFTRAATFYGDLMEEYPARQGGNGSDLRDFYRFEDTRYQEYLAAYLRVLLLNPQRDTRRTRISIADVALKIHWWWSIFTPLEALDRILGRIELALNEAQRVRPDEDFSEEKALLERLRQLDRTYPREERWAYQPSVEACADVLENLGAIRRALGCDFEYLDEEDDRARLYPGDDGDLDLLDVAAITDMYRGNLYLHQANALGPGDPQHSELLASARAAQVSARERFSRNMTWSVIYTIGAQSAIEFTAGNAEAARAFAVEALRLCRASDALDLARWQEEETEGETEERDGKAEAYRILADGLMVDDPVSALEAYRLAHWEAFAYLWDPEKAPPNDSYTIGFYRVMCERFAHALRQAAHSAPRAAEKAARTTADFWTGWGPEPAMSPPPALRNRLPALLTGWTKQERFLLDAKDPALRQTYTQLTRALFPAVPAETDRAYAKAAKVLTQKRCAAMWSLRDTLLTRLETKTAP